MNIEIYYIKEFGVVKNQIQEDSGERSVMCASQTDRSLAMSDNLEYNSQSASVLSISPNILFVAFV